MFPLPPDFSSDLQLINIDNELINDWTAQD